VAAVATACVCIAAAAERKPVDISVRMSDGTMQTVPLNDALRVALTPLIQPPSIVAKPTDPPRATEAQRAAGAPRPADGAITAAPKPPAPATQPAKPPPPAGVPVAFSIRVGQAVHVDAAGEPASWDFGDPDGDYNFIHGTHPGTGVYTAAHVYDKPGDYLLHEKVEQSGAQSNRLVHVAPDSRPVLPYTGKAPLAAHTVYDLGGQTIVTQSTIRLDGDDITLVNGRIRRSLCDDTACIRVKGNGYSIVGVTMDTDRTLTSYGWRKVQCRGIEVFGTDCVIDHCKGYNLDTFVITRASASRTTLREAWTSSDLRSYGVYVEATQHVITLNPVHLMSHDEHNIRVMGGATFVGVWRGELTMDVAARGDKQGGCLELREAILSYACGTVCHNGQVRSGPYGETGLLNDPNRHCRNVMFDGVQLTGPTRFYIRAGSERITLRDCGGPIVIEAMDPRFPQRPTDGVFLSRNSQPARMVGKPKNVLEE
jgi:hypothetical protein